MALGSSSYPNFCEAGKDMDREFTRLGAKAISETVLGDELEGQADMVEDWQVDTSQQSLIGVKMSIVI